MRDADTSGAIEGGCRCGRLRFRVWGPPLLTSACHCTGCQKMSASAFSLTVAMPADAFEVIAGEPVIGGLHGPVARHHHCDHCKSWVYTAVDGAPFVNVRPTMLDAHHDFAPYMEMHTAEKLPWATTPAVRSYAGQPPFEDFPRLIEEHRGWHAARQEGA